MRSIMGERLEVACTEVFSLSDGNQALCNCRYEPLGFLERFWSAQAIASKPKRKAAEDDKMEELVEAMLADSVSKR